MSTVEQDKANDFWRLAEIEEKEGTVDVPNTVAGAGSAGPQVQSEVRDRIRQFLLATVKWSHRDFHDAVMAAGLNRPLRPSPVNYFQALREQFADTQLSFLPQNAQSHTKARYDQVLRILGRGGTKLGGKLSDNKSVLAQRFQ